MPSRAVDAAGLLAARDRRSESRRLRREQDAVLPQGRGARAAPRRCRSAEAVTLREGRDVTIVALSRLVHDALAAAERLAAEDGIEAEVIDPRTLVPLDLEAIVESVKRTGRLVVAHEAVEHGGFGAEIAAQVQEAAFDFLDAPIGRVGAPFAPIPFSAPLEDAYLPGADEIVAAVRATLSDQTIGAVVSGYLILRRFGVRLRDRRRGIGGMCACGASQRGPRRQGRACSRPGAGTAGRRSRCRWPSRCCSSRASTGTSTASRSRASAAGGCTMPRGKVIGGSGSINAMIYVRGNRADYDEWAAGGAEGWSYDEVLPYFKRSEDNERGEDAFHGVGGPLSVSDSRAMSPLIETMIEASRARGPRAQPRLQRRRARRASGRFQLTQRNGRRCSTAAAFLHPALERPNLDVFTDAMALRILFDGSRAVGVEVARDGKVEEIRAERDVILSAGRLPVAGAADDLRHRARRGSRALRDRGPREPAGRAQPPGPLHGAGELRDRRAVALRRLHAGELRAARDRGPRAADVQHPRGRGVLPHSAGAGRARHRVPLRRRRCSTTRG